MSQKVKAIASVAFYAAAILAANVLTQWYGMVPVGFGLLVTAGTFAAGLALLARDFVHRYANVWWVIGGIVVGIALSWFLASPALALASAAAFAVAEVVDMFVYLGVRRRGFVTAAVASNIISAPLDTVVFLLIAGFPLTLETLTGQLIGKLLWATAVPLIIFAGVKYAVLRKSFRPASS